MDRVVKGLRFVFEHRKHVTKAPSIGALERNVQKSRSLDAQDIGYKKKNAVLPERKCAFVSMIFISKT